MYCLKTTWLNISQLMALISNMITYRLQKNIRDWVFLKLNKGFYRLVSETTQTDSPTGLLV